MGSKRPVPARRGLHLGRGVASAITLAWLTPAVAPPIASGASEVEGATAAGASKAGSEAGDAQGTLRALETEVRDADELLRGARFEEALDRLDAIRGRLAGPSGGDAERRLRARAEVMAATAYVALDREDAARECFRRALAAEPALDLDPATTSPKVLRVFRVVREEPRGPR